VAQWCCGNADLLRDCVSHCILEKSADFFKNNRNFQPHCVSHYVPRDSRRRRPFLARTIHTQALAQPMRTLRRRFALAPALAGPPVTLLLAVGATAHRLPITGAWMWTKPMPADPARAFATHREPPTEIGEPRCSNSVSSTVGQFCQAEAGQFWRASKCFDRVVINGYLSGLSRPENVVYFFRDVLGIRAITKEVLSARTRDYQAWVEAYARKQKIPIEWAEKGVRKEDYVRPWLQRMQRQQRPGVYFIFKSMEQGTTFRSTAPKFPTADPDYRILGKQRSRFTHYYFYIRDDTLGPLVLRVASFLPFQTTYYLNGHSFIEQELRRLSVPFRKRDNAFLAVADPRRLQAAADRFTPRLIQERLDYWTFVLGPKFALRERRAMNLRRFYAIGQVEYCRNFIFRRHFPIHHLFERSCEFGLWRLTAHKISQIFGVRITKRLHGKLQSTLEQIEHGHHICRAYCKNSFVKQYEKFRTFLRNEVCSNNLRDFGLKKGLEHLAAVRTAFLGVTDRFAAFQAQWLNVHVDFPLLQHLAQPLVVGRTKFPGLKIHEPRIIRLLEVLLHAGTQIAGWRAAAIHDAILTTYGLTPDRYRITQLRYDLRKLKAHGLLQRDGTRYAYRLTSKGLKVALLFVLFHKQLCGPLANSLFHHRPHANAQHPQSKLEAALYKADTSIHRIIRLLEAA